MPMRCNLWSSWSTLSGMISQPLLLRWLKLSLLLLEMHSHMQWSSHPEENILSTHGHALSLIWFYLTSITPSCSQFRPVLASSHVLSLLPGAYSEYPRKAVPNIVKIPLTLGFRSSSLIPVSPDPKTNARSGVPSLVLIKYATSAIRLAIWQTSAWAYMDICPVCAGFHNKIMKKIKVSVQKYLPKFFHLNE